MSEDYVYVTKCINRYPSFDAPVLKLHIGGILEATAWAPQSKYFRDFREGVLGYYYGEGDFRSLRDPESVLWYLIKVLRDDIYPQGGWVKFRRGEIVLIGTVSEIATALLPLLPNNRPYYVNGLTLTVGHGGTVIAGHMSNLIGGDESFLVAGDSSSLTGGDNSTLEGGNYSKLSAGRWATLTGGQQAYLEAGHCSKLTAGDNSKLKVGDYGTIIAGVNSRCKAGCESTIIAEHQSQVTGGLGTIFITEHYYQGKWIRRVDTVGEYGIEPGVKYVSGCNGNLMEKD